MSENEISYILRGCIFRVYNFLGPGLLESVYEKILTQEIIKTGLAVRCQVPYPVTFGDVMIEAGFRADLVVENKVIVEVKSIEKLLEVHHKQLITYLKISGLKLGLLVNFNCKDLSSSIFRKVNNL